MAADDREKDLVRGSRQGDSKAFDELIRLDYPKAKALAFRLTCNESDADDLVEETYLKICVSIKSFKGDSRFSTWRHQIEQNCFLDRCRRQENRQAREVPLDPAGEDDEKSPARIPDPSPGPEAETASKDRLLHLSRKVWDALRKINPVYRILLIMVDMNEDAERPSYDEALAEFKTLLQSGEQAYEKSMPRREGLSFESFKELHGEVQKRNSYDLKLFHARKAFAKAWKAAEGGEAP